MWRSSENCAQFQRVSPEKIVQRKITVRQVTPLFDKERRNCTKGTKTETDSIVAFGTTYDQFDYSSHPSSNLPKFGNTFLMPPKLPPSPDTYQQRHHSHPSFGNSRSPQNFLSRQPQELRPSSDTYQWAQKLPSPSSGRPTPNLPSSPSAFQRPRNISPFPGTIRQPNLQAESSRSGCQRAPNSTNSGSSRSWIVAQTKSRRSDFFIAPNITEDGSSRLFLETAKKNTEPFIVRNHPMANSSMWGKYGTGAPKDNWDKRGTNFPHQSRNPPLRQSIPTHLPSTSKQM